MPDQSQGTPAGEPEQWVVVEEEPRLFDLCPHMWRIVRLRSSSGKLSQGVQCVKCGDVERVTERQMNARGGVRYGGDYGKR